MTISTFDNCSTRSLPVITTAWTELASRLHTTSPDQAQAWRDHGLDVAPVTDPDQIAAAEKDPRVVWV